MNIAKHYVNRGMSLPDLIEEGNIGLLKAVEGFDPEMGCRFSTYASWWIKQAIKRSLINAVQPIHIPAYMVEMMTKLKYGVRELEAKLGRLPSTEELSDHLKVSVKKVKIIRSAVKAYNSPTQSGSDDGESSINDMVADDNTPSPDQQVHDNDELRQLGELLEGFDERAAKILKLRYGLEGEELGEFTSTIDSRDTGAIASGCSHSYKTIARRLRCLGTDSSCVARIELYNSGHE
ncbi:MAG: sigma-70 family RNA polymerase sigma factor [Planctomycetes bacterium]|nr:sigma-70 family RNA polymerase sigma factor [Planctomycetota bacterium]